MMYLRDNDKNINPLSANPTKWSNTLKQFVGNLPNCLSVFDHFVILALKGLINIILMSLLLTLYLPFYCQYYIFCLPPVKPEKQLLVSALRKVTTKPITARCCFPIPPENIRKPKGFRMLSGVVGTDNTVL